MISQNSANKLQKNNHTMKLSICIPTYNRANHLVSCLNSIITCSLNSDLQFQVCVSDNHSTDETEAVVRNAQLSIDIKYHKNFSNLGIARNILKVASIADGDFVWLLGDDDLLMPDAIEALYRLIDLYPDVDFFYLNSFHLTTEYVQGYPSPFDTANLPVDMEPFSKWKNVGVMPFFALIDPRVSFDFLGGIFLSVFRKETWAKNTHVLNQSALEDNRTFSHPDNTFPHIKIFASAFSKSKAYFNDQPLSVCLTGAREWTAMGPLVMSVRLVEALQEYRNNGLPYWQYFYCKNHALRNFLPDFLKLLRHKDSSGYIYISPFKLLAKSLLYPNFYMSVLYFTGRQMGKLLQRIVNIFIS